MKYVLMLLMTCATIISFGQSIVENFNSKKGLALEGYDPVSYYSGEPQEGEEGISASYHGVAYYFISKKNKETFLENPDKYEPAYGGWCAYAMGESGEKVKVDPETFKIINDKIYLFYNFWGTNTLNSWNKNEKTLKSKADINWKKLTR